ncbi:MAG: 1-acyl-sn-glycerol-3-phosphate acyltransferase [Acidobacteria bacterium]|nr:1-acyl-sn-glycerol-3-phosphate acyltransferase [Acidobacteriota bacterium]
MREIPKKYRIFFPSSLMEDVLATEGDHPNPIFAEGLLRRWNVSHTYAGPPLPASGAAIVAANHPTGVLDGVLLNALLHRARPNLKIIANSLLQAFDPLADVVIAVNPFGKAERENLVPIRQALQWLRQGGMLLMFPAGEVAHWTWKDRAVTEPPWLESAARLAMKAGA